MHFVIVSYTFPPSREIGGRRWGKFSKYIYKEGHSVTVVCAENKADKDFYRINYQGIEIIKLPKYYPELLKGQTKNFIEKILYFIITRIISPVIKYNIFDWGLFWKNPLLNILNKLHKKQPIDVLIITGAPFSLLYYGTFFKRNHKDIFYIIDLRDPWTTGENYGFKTMNSKKREFQEFQEKESVQYADLVCVPTDIMKKYFVEKYPECLQKIYLLPHAFEPEIFNLTSNLKIENRFIYGGTLYNDIEEELIKVINVIEKNAPKDFKWEIYSNTPYKLLENIPSGGKVMKHSFIPENELFSKISSSKAYLMIYPETDKDFISTKFFEIIYAKTPIIFIGKNGEISEFIKKNKLGVHISPESIEKELPTYLSGDIKFEGHSFDISQYYFLNVTKSFLEKIVSTRHNTYKT